MIRLNEKRGGGIDQNGPPLPIPYQSDQYISYCPRAARQPLGDNLGDNKQKIGLKRSYHESALPDGA